jgi:hypothetical protein
MKKVELRPMMGRRVTDRRSWGILARNFEANGEDFLFLLFSPWRRFLQRPAAVKGARVGGAAERTLDGEDRCGTISQGGKSLF